MPDSASYETPDHRPLAEDVSAEGHLREYTYGEFEDDDLWDDDGDRPGHCGSCGGDELSGYECEFAGLDCYVPGPDQYDDEGHLVNHGCPRVVGAF